MDKRPECIICINKRKKKAKKYALALLLFAGIYLGGIIFFEYCYIRLLEEDSTALILTNDAVSAKQISSFNKLSNNYNLTELKDEIKEVIKLDYTYQQTYVVNTNIVNPVGEHISYEVLLNKVHTSILPIGQEWAYFYCNRYLKNGYNEFTIQYKTDLRLEEEMQSIFESDGYTLLMINIYNTDGVSKEENIPIIFRKKDFEKLNLKSEQLYSKSRISISELSYLLEKGVNYLDDSVKLAKKSRLIAPEKMDCLYFSVVTITTTGYGDVLPNSRQARIFVQLEIVYGLLVMGLILSSLWSLLSSLKNL